MVELPGGWNKSGVDRPALARSTRRGKGITIGKQQKDDALRGRDPPNSHALFFGGVLWVFIRCQWLELVYTARQKLK
jgi:hypothetical protein